MLIIGERINSSRKEIYAAILDPSDRVLMANLKAADLIMGEDEFCVKYIQAYREGKFKGLP
jgi:5-methyltetrahydrofolate--homocysteine methyltransferase